MEIERLSKRDNELLSRVDEVLHYLWDPIGIRGVPAARDEYSSYAGVVFSLLKRSAGIDEICEYLRKIKVVHIGIGRMEHIGDEKEIAELLIDWKETFFDE